MPEGINNYNQMFPAASTNAQAQEADQAIDSFLNQLRAGEGGAGGSGSSAQRGATAGGEETTSSVTVTPRTSAANNSGSLRNNYSGTFRSGGSGNTGGLENKARGTFRSDGAGNVRSLENSTSGTFRSQGVGNGESFKPADARQEFGNAPKATEGDFRPVAPGELGASRGGAGSSGLKRPSSFQQEGPEIKRPNLGEASSEKPQTISEIANERDSLVDRAQTESGAARESDFAEAERLDDQIATERADATEEMELGEVVEGGEEAEMLAEEDAAAAEGAEAAEGLEGLTDLEAFVAEL